VAVEDVAEATTVATRTGVTKDMEPMVDTARDMGADTTDMGDLEATVVTQEANREEAVVVVAKGINPIKFIL